MVVELLVVLLLVCSIQCIAIVAKCLKFISGQEEGLQGLFAGVLAVASSGGILEIVVTGHPKKASWVRLFRFLDALTLTFQPPHRLSLRHSRMSSRS